MKNGWTSSSLPLLLLLVVVIVVKVGKYFCRIFASSLSLLSGLIIIIIISFFRRSKLTTNIVYYYYYYYLFCFRFKIDPTSALLGVAAAAAVCPNVCECKWTDGKETVSCRNANLTDVPRNLDSTVLILDLDGNALTSLNADAFNLAGLWNLQRIYLVRCKIRTIDENAFRALKNVVYLDLSYNVLIRVPSSSLRSLTELRELKLSGNPILKIGANAFASVRRLKRLDVSECRIGYVDTTAFSGLENTLEKLTLDRNRISNVEPVAFTLLHSLHAIDLQSNPWNCSCLLRPLRHWLLQRTVPLGPSPICKYPPRNANKTWSELSKEEFACLPRLSATRTAVIANEGENVTLSCKLHDAVMSSITVDGGIRDGTTPNVRWILRSRILLNGNYEYPVTNKKPYVKHLLTSEYANLTILALELQDSGVYVCVAENVAGKVSAEITLTVLDRRLSSEPALPEKYVTMGILLSVMAVVLLCALVLVIRVMDGGKPSEQRQSVNSVRCSLKLPTSKITSGISVDSINDSDNKEQRITGIDTTNDNKSTVFDNNRSPVPGKVIGIKDGTIAGSSKTVNDADKKKTIQKNIDRSQTNTVADSPYDVARKPPSTSRIQKDSPRNSIFDSHIGEIALQHHVLHKKELPTGNLYTTAMSFMQEDNLATNNYYVDNDNEEDNSGNNTYVVDKNKKQLRDNRDYSTDTKYLPGRKGRNDKRYYNSSDGQSQSPLLASRVVNNYYQEENDSSNIASTKQRKYSTFDRNPPDADKSENYRSSSLHVVPDDKYRRYRATGTDIPDRSYTSSKRPFDHHRLPRRRYVEDVNESTAIINTDADSSTKETPHLLNKKSYHTCRNAYDNDNVDTSNGSLTLSPTRTSTTYDYHSAQLERFLHEYRQIHSELTKMKESCEKLDHRKRSSDKIHSSRSSLERSVSFVPNLKDTGIRSAIDDTPRSILKKTQLECDDNNLLLDTRTKSNRRQNHHYYYYYDGVDDASIPYRSSTLPLSRRRYRRYSTSSLDDRAE